MSPAAPEDALSTLERALRETVEGEVAFTPGARALYASDASNYRHPPLGVVFPRTVEDVVAEEHEHQQLRPQRRRAGYGPRDGSGHGHVARLGRILTAARTWPNYCPQS